MHQRLDMIAIVFRFAIVVPRQEERSQLEGGGGENKCTMLSIETPRKGNGHGDATMRHEAKLKFILKQPMWARGLTTSSTHDPRTIMRTSSAPAQDTHTHTHTHTHRQYRHTHTHTGHKDTDYRRHRQHGRHTSDTQGTHTHTQRHTHTHTTHDKQHASHEAAMTATTGNENNKASLRPACVNCNMLNFAGKAHDVVRHPNSAVLSLIETATQNGRRQLIQLMQRDQRRKIAEGT